MAPRLLLLLGFLATVIVPPALAGDVDQQALWPADLDRPDAERVAAIEETLGFAADYWYRTSSGLGSAWGTYESEYMTGPRFSSHMIDDTVKRVQVQRQDGSTTSFNVTVQRRVDQVYMPAPTACDEAGRCTQFPGEYRSVEVDSVSTRDLPFGIVFTSHNHVQITVPLGFFDDFGRGNDAVRAVAERLGIPTDRFDWSHPSYQNLSSGTARFAGVIPPGVDEVRCDCLYRQWGARPRPLGTGEIHALFSSGSLVAFSSNVWLRSGIEPLVTSEEAIHLAREAMIAEGLERWRGEGVSDPNDGLRFPLVRSVFLPDHGLAWRVEGPAEGATRSAWVETFVDAATGDVVHTQSLETSGGGYVEPFFRAPPVWAFLLVLMAAWLLMRPWGEKRRTG